MIQELTLIGTFIAIVTSLFLMFMPALMELKEPQDVGPRLILENFVPLSATSLTQVPILIDLESDAQIAMTYERFLRFLPNIESTFSE